VVLKCLLRRSVLRFERIYSELRQAGVVHDRCLGVRNCVCGYRTGKNRTYVVKYSEWWRFTSRSSRLWRRVMLQQDVSVSKDLAASVFRAREKWKVVISLHKTWSFHGDCKWWRWRQQGSPKLWHTTATLHGVTTWRRRQQGPPKLWCPNATLYGVVTQKTATCILICHFSGAPFVGCVQWCVTRGSGRCFALSHYRLQTAGLNTQLAISTCHMGTT